MSQPTKLYLFHRSNGIYYIGWYAGGKRRWRSSGCRRKADALRHLREFQTTLTPQTPLVLTISEFQHEFLAYAERTYAKKTVRLYKDALVQLTSFLGDIRFDEISTLDADRFKVMRARNLKAITVNKELSTLRAAFNTVRRCAHLTSNPFSGIQMLRVPEKMPEFLAPDQLRRLLEMISENWLCDVVLFAVATGMRRGEILSLRWEHVDLERALLHIMNTPTFRTKTGKRRTIPLSSLAAMVLRRREALGCDGPVFTWRGKEILADTLTHRFKRAVRHADLPDEFRFHSLRHTHASLLAQAGVSLYKIGALLGHTSAKTTQVYCHLFTEHMHTIVGTIKGNIASLLPPHN